MIWILKEKNYAVTEYCFSIFKETTEMVCEYMVMMDKIKKDKGNVSSDIFIVGTITKSMNFTIKKSCLI